MIRLILISLLMVGCGPKKRTTPSVFEVSEQKDLTPVGGPAADPVLASAAEKADNAEVVEVEVEETEPAKKAEPIESNSTVSIEAGKRAYISACIQCHNRDPNKKGSLGPELVDAPLELMKIKVATGRYPDVLPPGFVPKRSTKVMRKLPNSVKDVPNIHAWIQSVKNK